MNWDNFWAWFNQSTDNIQLYLLQQVDLGPLLKRVSPKVQIEILSNAPKYVVKFFSKIIDEKTLKSLGYGSDKPKSTNMMKYLLG